MASSLPQRCIDTIRCLGADIVQKANSGHPGAPMGCAPIAHTLFSKVMRFDPKQPKWFNRDRFVLSNGHASALLYTMLHLTGYEGMTMDALKSFRKLHSVCAGHPENILHPAIEVSTGPLGQGITNAVGMAIAEAHLAATFNKPGHTVIDNHTFVLCGDGCLQEGISSEAASLAGHLGLGKLIVCYDDNGITIDGHTDLSFTEDVKARYEAYGWHVLTVPDGNTNYDAIEAAILAAKAVTDRPSLIKIRTTIGIGSKHADSHTAHGAPLGAEDIANVKKLYGFNPEEHFAVPAEVAAHYAAVGAAGTATAAAWGNAFAAYTAAFPSESAELLRRIEGRLPAGWKDLLPRGKVDAPLTASRNHSGNVLNAIKDIMPELMGGSADLSPSNMTSLKGIADFQKASRHGRYLRFGVREHAMVAICNGMVAYGAILPFCATFLNFYGYALGAVRLSSLSHMRVLMIATHDSIQLGEDGPTHQPVEMLLALRATPNTLVFRPVDATETSACYAVAIEFVPPPPPFFNHFRLHSMTYNRPPRRPLFFPFAQAHADAFYFRSRPHARPEFRRLVFREGPARRVPHLRGCRGRIDDPRRRHCRDGRGGRHRHRRREEARGRGSARSRRVPPLPRSLRGAAARVPRDGPAARRARRVRRGQRYPRLGALRACARGAVDVRGVGARKRRPQILRHHCGRHRREGEGCARRLREGRARPPRQRPEAVKTSTYDDLFRFSLFY